MPNVLIRIAIDGDITDAQLADVKTFIKDNGAIVDVGAFEEIVQPEIRKAIKRS